MNGINIGDVATLFESYAPDNQNATEAAVIADKVNSYINSLTFGRSSGTLDADAQEKVDSCASELVLFLVRECFDPEISSETTDDWSRTLAHAGNSTVQSEMYSIASRWLAGSGLMYCGV